MLSETDVSVGPEPSQIPSCDSRRVHDEAYDIVGNLVGRIGAVPAFMPDMEQAYSREAGYESTNSPGSEAHQLVEHRVRQVNVVGIDGRDVRLGAPIEAGENGDVPQSVRTPVRG